MPATMSAGTEVFMGERSNALTAVAATQLDTTSSRVRRVWSLAATSTIAIYDHPSANTNLVYTVTAATAGLIFTIDCPLKNGLRVDVTAGQWMITWD